MDDQTPKQLADAEQRQGCPPFAWSRVLTPAERRKVEEYLARVYGIELLEP